MKHQFAATSLLLVMAFSLSECQQMKLKTVLAMINTKAPDCFTDKKKQMPDLLNAMAQLSTSAINGTKTKCLPSCVLEKLGILSVDNHSISIETLKTHVETIPHPKIKAFINEQAEFCGKNTTSEENCDKGFQFVQCFINGGLLSNVYQPPVLNAMIRKINRNAGKSGPQFPGPLGGLFSSSRAADNSSSSNGTNSSSPSAPPSGLPLFSGLSFSMKLPFGGGGNASATPPDTLNISLPFNISGAAPDNATGLMSSLIAGAASGLNICNGSAPAMMMSPLCAAAAVPVPVPAAGPLFAPVG